MHPSTHSGKPERWRAGAGPARLALLFLLAVLITTVACRNPDQPVASAAQKDSGASDGAREGIEGTVTSADGTPLAGVFVQAESLDEPAQRIPELAIVTGEDGRYLWPLSPGRYRISVSAEGHPPAADTATVEPGRRTTLSFTLR
jgi:hypothetical protein